MSPITDSDTEQSDKKYQPVVQYSPVVVTTETPPTHVTTVSSKSFSYKTRIAPPTHETTVSSKSFNYKIVGDNLNKSVRPRYMRMKSYQNQSLHFFHSFAVLDWIDTSGLSDSPMVVVNLVMIM